MVRSPAGSKNVKFLPDQNRTFKLQFNLKVDLCKQSPVRMARQTRRQQGRSSAHIFRVRRRVQRKLQKRRRDSR